MCKIIRPNSTAVKNLNSYIQSVKIIVCLFQMVEDFIRATPDYTHMEKEWEDIVRFVFDKQNLVVQNIVNLMKFANKICKANINA